MLASLKYKKHASVMVKVSGCSASNPAYPEIVPLSALIACNDMN